MVPLDFSCPLRISNPQHELYFAYCVLYFLPSQPTPSRTCSYSTQRYVPTSEHQTRRFHAHAKYRSRTRHAGACHSTVGSEPQQRRPWEAQSRVRASGSGRQMARLGHGSEPVWHHLHPSCSKRDGQGTLRPCCEAKRRWQQRQWCDDRSYHLGTKQRWNSHLGGAGQEGGSDHNQTPSGVQVWCAPRVWCFGSVESFCRSARRQLSKPFFSALVS